MSKPKIIFEMANNHMGDINHGLLMVNEFGKIAKNFEDSFDFIFKFQFRDIPTFIHPHFKDRMDIKYVKRFSETDLTDNEFKKMFDCARSYGMKIMTTPFDENSVDRAEKLSVDIVKIASCSCADWPLLERIVKVNKEIIFSTAGQDLDTIDEVVSFFKNRNKSFSIMHCVGEYPTQDDKLQINQIALLKERYVDVPIGFSTHEEPDNFNSIFLAIGQGALLFEKHIAIDTKEYPKNAYSSTPEQIIKWLKNAKDGFSMLGVKNRRHEISEKEKSDLRQFKRGVFVNKKLEKGAVISSDDLFYAWPSEDNQFVANDMSKYLNITLLKKLEKNEPLMTNNVKVEHQRDKVMSIFKDVKSLLNKSEVIYPRGLDIEISHHYGIENFYETGISMITVVNRDYCKKLIAVLPKQNHPEQFHKKKEETFHVLYGDVQLYLDDKHIALKVGDTITINPNVKHSFTTDSGCVLEEISSTHFVDDSYYTDPNILKNKNRKTFIKNWH